jgi:hypothetical protein
MDEAAFRELLAEHLVPMLAGTKLGARRKSNPAHALVAYEDPCALLMKPLTAAPYRVELVRSQPFRPEEKRLVALFLAELADVVGQADEPYFRDLMLSVPRRAISKFLPGPRGRVAFAEAVQAFEALASQTYEGRPVVAALGMTGSMGHGPIKLRELWHEPFSRVLSNGLDTIYLAGSDGRVFKVHCLPPPPSVEFAPHRLGAIAAWCRTPQRVALVLNRNGEVLILKDQRLQFAKRRGAWRYYAHDSVVRRLGVGNKALRRAVYESCLDVSFARTGGCIAVLSAKNQARLTRVVQERDLIEDQSHTRTKLLACTVTRPFHRLDRRLRQELISMDGATVLTHTGTVLTSGSIVRVPAGSTGGGRKAAAMQLSALGLAIKISADGPITGFRKRKLIFSLGDVGESRA